MSAVTARLPRLQRLRVAMPGITAIGVKELRGRMRGRRAFVSVTVYTLIVSGFAWMVGRILVEQAQFQFAFDPSYQSASIGRGIFIALMFLQTLMVAVLAPASTAGTISGERERQTLDLLTVTPISSLAIVAGKLLSSLTWVFTLILASIPVTALVFVYGGVAPDDVVRGYLLLFLEAYLFGALGVFFSALIRRSGAATGLTFVAILVATVGLTFVWVFFRATEANNLDGATLLARRPPEALLYLNPFVAQADVACGTEGSSGSWCQVIGQITGDPTIFAQPVGNGCVQQGDVVTCFGQAGGAAPPIGPVRDGPAIVAPGFNDVAPFDPNSLRDRYWPRSALAMLILAFGVTAAAVQLVSPTRRWRPRLPGIPRRPAKGGSA